MAGGNKLSVNLFNYHHENYLNLFWVSGPAPSLISHHHHLLSREGVREGFDNKGVAALGLIR